MLPLRAHELLSLELLLAGPESPLAVLRTQAEKVGVSRRTYNSFGEYVDLVVPPAAERAIPSNLILGDIELNVTGVSHPVTVLLYIENGLLSHLEFSTIEGDWPEEPSIESAYYLREVPSGQQSFALEPVQFRHPTTLARALAGRGTPSAA